MQKSGLILTDCKDMVNVGLNSSKSAWKLTLS